MPVLEKKAFEIECYYHKFIKLLTL